MVLATTELLNKKHLFYVLLIFATFALSAVNKIKYRKAREERKVII
jgi:hypothetical protein